LLDLAVSFATKTKIIYLAKSKGKKIGLNGGVGMLDSGYGFPIISF